MRCNVVIASRKKTYPLPYFVGTEDILTKSTNYSAEAGS